jgi:hypothetical protein
LLEHENGLEFNSYECRFELKSSSLLKMIVQLTLDKTVIIAEDDVITLVFLETFDGEELYKACAVVNSIHSSYKSL